MAFTVTLFNFAKKENSTAQPQATIKAPYVLGGLQSTDGTETAVPNRARTDYIDLSVYRIGLSIPQDYKYGFFYYNSSRVFLSWSGWRTNASTPPTTPTNARYVRIVCAFVNDSSLSQSDISLFNSITNLIPAHPAVSITMSDTVLLDSCSVVNPIILVNVKNMTRKDVFNFNYCYIAEFSRYYFIVDWTYSGGLWVATCRVDPLASWKSNIMQTSCYVMRSTYDNNGNVLYNGDVADGKYPTTAAQATYSASATDNPFTQVDGVYLVGIVNSQSANGAVTYYAFNALGFKSFCQILFNYSTGWLNIDTSEISSDLQKALINPFQYVVSCQYLPINVSDITSLPDTTATTTIRFGWWSVTVPQGARIVTTYDRIRRTSSLTIPRHPSAASRGNYLNLSPYSLYTLRYYPFGTIDIDSEAIAGWTTLDLYADLDLCTGKGILNICVNGFNNPIRTIEAQLGVQIPTASLQTSYTNIATGKTAVVAAGASLIGKLNNVGGNAPNPADYEYSFKGFLNYSKDTIKSWGQDVKEAVAPSGSIKQTATDIINTAIAASTTAEIQGMQGNASAYNAQTLTLSGRFLPLPAEDFSHIGRPLMATRTMNTLSGFVVCQEADISFSCTERERGAIKAYMEGGFFIE